MPMEYSKPFLGNIVTVTVDRPLGSKHPHYNYTYPVNYGFVRNTVAPDGAEIDAYVLGPTVPLPSCIGRCIAILHRTNDDDDKLIVCPDGYNFSDEEIRQLTLFQEQYFKSVIIRNPTQL